MPDIAAHHRFERSGSPTVADRLRGARRRGFVGRAAEIELFRGAVASAEPPFSVLWFHGPGGVGKTTLLGALAEAAEDDGHAPVRVDLRAIDPSPSAFRSELARAPALAAGERPLLLLDTFEAAAGLADWLRAEFVPSLPAGALVVVAGRSGPSDGWRREPGWRDLLRVVSLRNLGPDDTRALLRGAGVPDDLHERVLALTHGHPLALSLLVDVLSQRGAEDPGGISLEAVPDVVGSLVASFLAGVPSARHRRALEIAAHARVTDAGLLRAILGEREGEERFAWLRGLSFVEAGPDGIYPHDLARDVIDADLRWRDRAAYAEVHAQVRAVVVERLQGRAGRERQQALADLMFLHRGNPAARAFWDWESLGQVYADALRPGDGDAITRMVERHEGPASAAIASHWLERRPEAFAVFRGGGSAPLGFLSQLSLHETRDQDRARDPGAQAVWAHAQRHSPPRLDDEVIVGRFFADQDAYQAPSRSLNVVTMLTSQVWLSRPRLAWYYLVVADPDAFAPLMAYIRFERAPSADFDVGGRTFAVYARDWRREDGATWLVRMGERELGGEAPTPASAGAAPTVALSHQEFADAVRRALRDVHRRDALAANPLIRARVVKEEPGGGPAPEVLRRLLEDAVRALDADPREAKLVRALDRTYLRPAPTQEAAAELLGLPFSTYRGHLTRGLERVVDRLWRRELYGPEG